MLEPAEKRAEIDHAGKQHGLSRACAYRLFGLSGSTSYYVAKLRDDKPLHAALKAVALQRRRCDERISKYDRRITALPRASEPV